MKEGTAIIAALPREVKQLVRGWKRHPLPGMIVAYSTNNAVVVCAGMGPERAALAVQAAMSLKPVTTLFSIGLAGACNPKLAVGAIVRAGTVIDARSGERFADSEFQDVLVSASNIASVKEKLRLYESYDAAAVDMEAATVARIARGHGLGFHAIKAISDDATFELRELTRFATPDGQFREGAFAAHAAVRPYLWGRLVRLAGNSRQAIQALTNEVQLQLDLIR